MPNQKVNTSSKAQIALEFVIVYSFVLVLFVLMFTLVSTQRAATMAQQEYSLLQLQAQNIAGYIDQALGAGSGYTATIPLAGSIGAQQFNISISTTGVVIAQTKVGTQIIKAFAFSNARNMVINGTPTQSGNGITVYLVPILRGSVYLANSNGAIYIDTPPASTVGLARSITLTSIANTKMASFDGASSKISLGNSAALVGALSAVTVGMWIKTTVGGYMIAGRCTGGCSQGYAIVPTWDFYVWTSGGEAGAVSSVNIKDGAWHYVVGTYDANGGSNNVKVYVDGTLRGQGTTTGSIIAATNLYLGAYAGTSSWYNGLISNVQIYNTALSANQIASLYLGGIGGAPVVPANNVGWWPLNGGAKDYSGNNNNGNPTNIAYPSVAQINAQVKAGSGANVISTPMGIVTSKGTLGQTGNSLTLYTNATGSNTVFVLSNSVTVIANLTINTFDDNVTTVGNLIGWWPLNEGYGSIAYDLSGRYNNGAFSSPSWAPFANQTNLAVASFNGVSSYISTGTTGLPTGNNQRTVAAWINPSSGISSAKVFYFYGTDSASPYGYGMYVTSAYKIEVEFDSGNGAVISNKVLSPNTWYFIVATYSGTTSAIYINGVSDNSISYSSANTLAGTSDIGVWGSLASWFSGLIANVQIYGTALTPSQIQQLYQEGISSSPIGDAGLVGWWPLAYSATDYSSNRNNGVPTNLAFSNTNYTIPTASGAVVANFNGASSYITSTMPAITTNSETQIAWVYLRSLPSPGSYAQITSQSSGAGGLYVDSGGYPLFGAFLGSTFTAVGSPISMGTNQWHMLSGSYSGSAVSVCIDGTSCLTTPASGAIGSSSNPFYIGSKDGASWFANGEIADVQIYNTALTQIQIQQMYQQGLPLYSKLNVSLG